MKFVILGSGGRENIIIKKLKETDGNKLYCISNFVNPQIKSMVHKYVMVNDIKNNQSLLDAIIKIYGIDEESKEDMIVVPGSESFLEIGIVDLLLKYKIPCIAPLQKMAMIETSKAFARDYLQYNHLSEYQPRYQIFFYLQIEDIKKTIKDYNYNFVIKADGLCGGKGVRVYNDDNWESSMDYCKELLFNCTYSMHPYRFVIEERLFGEEFSLLSFCDGKHIKHMPLIQDYKDLDKNNTIKTGGMGCISLADHSFPFLSEEDLVLAQDLNRKIMENLSREGKYGYRGILYGGFMKTEKGIKLIEYNARFGDPECINLLTLLETPLTDIFKSIIRQDLNELDVKFKNEYSVCKYLVPEKYPFSNLNKNLNFVKFTDYQAFQKMYLAAITQDEQGEYRMKNSRSIAVVKTNTDLEECITEVHRDIDSVVGKLFHRRDIGNNYLPGNINNLYLQSGVNIEEGELVVQKIKESVVSTFDENVIDNFGDFGCLYDIQKKIVSGKYQHPILISSSDGVGTKTKLVLQILGEEKGLFSLGQDIVNHSVNDILVKGAEPLFFMDYVASSVIKSDNIKYLIEGMSHSCRENNLCLLGGETAEMPDVYRENCYDIVGTILGICDKEKIISGKDNIQEGDIVLGFLSSGPHTNGYSLIRKIVEEHKTNDNKIGNLKLEDLIKPHKSYLEEINMLRGLGVTIKGLCHITGGGYPGNLVRVLPDNLAMELKVKIMEPFATIQRLGNITDGEMYQTFNCGYGMLVIIQPQNKDDIIRKTFSHELGKVTVRKDGKEIIQML